MIMTMRLYENTGAYRSKKNGGMAIADPLFVNIVALNLLICTTENFEG